MRRLASLLAGSVVFAAPALGQAVGPVEMAVLGVWHNKTVPIDGLRGFGVGGRLGLWLPYNFEIEGVLEATSVINSTAPISRFALMHYGASALYNLTIDGGHSFYTRIGYGKLSPGGACRIHGTVCSGFAVGTVGIGVRTPVSGQLHFRGEGMYRTRSAYDYRSVGASIGVAYVIRRVSPVDATVDTDLDGVPDRRDKCKDTMYGALVDIRGCPTDTDGDGVYDGIDRCPGTPKGQKVDLIGCPTTEKPKESS